MAPRKLVAAIRKKKPLEMLARFFSNMFVGTHRAEIFQNFILQDCFKWDFGRPADVERIKQWEEIFITAYDDVINKRVGGDNCDSYIKCREYICKNW